MAEADKGTITGKKSFEIAIPGQSRMVTSNSHDILTITTAWDEEPVTGTPYRIRRRV